jgi:hypothetical protein
MATGVDTRDGGQGMLTLDDLERVAPRLLPHRSATGRPVDWELLQNTLGFVYPSDYREYVDRYPTLVFDDFMVIPVPEPGNESVYLGGMLGQIELMVGLAEDGGMEDYTFHPEEGGLFPWGGSFEGDSFFWRMSGPDPDQWPALVYTSLGGWWEYDGGMLAMVVGSITGSIDHFVESPRPGPNPTVETLGPPIDQA